MTSDPLRALAIDTREKLCAKWISVDEVDLALLVFAKQAQALQREADAQLVQALEPYLQHKGDCLKWGPSWEYPRHLHSETNCTCGLALQCQWCLSTNGDD